MRIGVIGLNHKTASLSVREQYARALEVISSWGVPTVVLSTCNRSEVYFSSEDLSSAHETLLACLRVTIDFEFEQYLYTFFGKDCFHHLARVVVGLDSAQIGECDISRQVKRAYAEAGSGLPGELHFLFQKAFKIGKDMRTRYDMSSWSVDLPHITKELFRVHGVERALFVGYSDINRKVMRRVGDLVSFDVLTRAEDIPYRRVSYGKPPSWDAYDAVVFGTKSPDYILTEPNALPELIVDLSVPRNVDPSLHCAAIVYNIDELQKACLQKEAEVAHIIAECERLVATSVDRQRVLYVLHEVA